MFICSRCIRCAVQGTNPELQGSRIVSRDVSRVASQRLSPGVESGNRTHATLASLNKGHHRRVARQTFKKWDKHPKQATVNRRRKAPGALTKTEIRDALAREKNRNMLTRGHVFEEPDDDEEDVQVDVEQSSHSAEEIEIKSKDTADDAAKQSQEAAKESQEAAKQRQKAARALQKEVQLYYKDPLQLAGGVINRLRVPDIEGALALVRASEQFGIDNIVSWNHCLDWFMSQGEVKQALKTYNEMKKRGHRPDAHTYTLMLRGISQQVAPRDHSTRTPTATTKTRKWVQEAVAIYNSIFAPNSAVKPSTIHTNAVINVCARAGEMESLWAIAGRLPNHGVGSPDQYTYTTILNAIRDHTIKEVAKTVIVKPSRGPAEPDAEQTRQRLYKRALADGRKLWEEISFRWRRANLIMDEQLVCAMGRLLIGCGAPKDVLQVLDLVDVSMNINIRERREAPIANWLLQENGSDSRSSAEVTLPARQDDTDLAAPSAAKPSMYATPSNNTLQMILHAASLHPSVQDLSKYYWIRLTDPNRQYRIVPDAANIIAYLRILRKTRSSHEAYKLLSREWPNNVQNELYRRATFIMAFSTCLRDKNNPNVFDTGGKLFDLMLEKSEKTAEALFAEDEALSELNGKSRKQALRARAAELSLSTDPEESHRRQPGVQSMTLDPKILNYYIMLALDTTTGWQEGIRGKDDGQKFERDPQKNHTMLVLNKIRPYIIELQRLIQLRLTEMDYQHVPALTQARKDVRAGLSNNRAAGYGSKVGEKIEDLLELMRTVIGAYDKVVVMADRFRQTGREPIDPALVKKYDMGKREYTTYMTKVDNRTRSLLQNARKLRSADRDLGLEDGPTADDSQPEISRTLQDIKNTTETEMKVRVLDKRERKTQKKGFKRSEIDQTKKPLVLSSRRQKQEMQNMIQEKMKKYLPVADVRERDDADSILGIEQVREAWRVAKGQSWKQRDRKAT